MSRRKKYKPIQVSAPMIVVRTLHNTGLELRERVAVNAFTQGYATTEHYDLMAYLMNLLLLAGSTDKHRHYAQVYAENTVKPVLESIAERYQKTGKFGVNAQELHVLVQLVDFNKAFWLRQNSDLFHIACAEVDAFFKERSAARETQHA
jgi:hypothetical protein